MPTRTPLIGGGIKGKTLRSKKMQSRRNSFTTLSSATPTVLLAYVASACEQSGNSTFKTAEGIRSAMKQYFQEKFGCQGASWSCDNDKCTGNPVFDPTFNDYYQSLRSRDGRTRITKQSLAMSHTDMAKLMGHLQDNATIEKESKGLCLWFQAFAATSFVLWTRNEELLNLKAENLERNLVTESGSPYFTITLPWRKSTPTDTSKGNYNARFTSHCFRRGGAQYRFMFAKERWSLEAVKWWGGWSDSEGTGSIMRYLLDDALEPHVSAPLDQQSLAASLQVLQQSLLSDMMSKMESNISSINTTITKIRSEIAQQIQALALRAPTQLAAISHTSDTGRVQQHRTVAPQPAPAVRDVPGPSSQLAPVHNRYQTGATQKQRTTAQQPVSTTRNASRRSSAQVLNEPPAGQRMLNAETWLDCIQQWEMDDSERGLTVPLEDGTHSLRKTDETRYFQRKSIANKHVYVGENASKIRDAHGEAMNSVRALIPSIRKQKKLRMQQRLVATPRTLQMDEEEDKDKEGQEEEEEEEKQEQEEGADVHTVENSQLESVEKPVQNLPCKLHQVQVGARLDTQPMREHMVQGRDTDDENEEPLIRRRSA
ncbi:hypothetical protein EC968_005976 [Mortierella alpina]|nr:hypothetical protein EC968_005976 [Mortierella alpina]